MILFAIPQLLLAISFGSMASVMKTQGKKSIFVPVVFAALSAIVTFVYNVTGLGFAVTWGIKGAIVFLAVDALLVAGLLLTGIALKKEN